MDAGVAKPHSDYVPREIFDFELKGICTCFATVMNSGRIMGFKGCGMRFQIGVPGVAQR